MPTTAAVIGATAAVAGTVASFTQGGPGDAPQFSAKVARKILEDEIELLPRRAEAEVATREALDPRLAQLQADIARDISPQQVQTILDIQTEFGPQFAELARQIQRDVDPDATAIRDELGRGVLNELRSGRELTAEQRRESQQASRAAQASRGNIFGNAAILEEALDVTSAGERRLQQRQANAAAFLSGQQPINQFASLSGAGQIAPIPFPTGALPGSGLQATGSFGDAFGLAQQGFANNIASFSAGANAPNPWMEGLGTIAGAGFSLAALPPRQQQVQQVQQFNVSQPSIGPLNSSGVFQP